MSAASAHESPAVAPRPGPRPLRIAILAPPWIAVPPPGYGGIESVVALLCEELAARGHHVTLFAPSGSRSRATVQVPLSRPHPDQIGAALIEADHVARAFAQLDAAARRGRPFDLLHDHCGFTAVAMADRIAVPVVHTLHGPFTEQTASFYECHGRKAHLVAISDGQRAAAPPGVRPDSVAPNPIAIEEWPLCAEKHDYLLWIGRMDPVKGAHRAIEAARLAGARLLLAGPVQRGQERYFQERIEPQLDGRTIRFLGEVTGERRKWLFARARGMLMPIRWSEPFGMVMIESLAGGTPVIAFPEGAAQEIVLDGQNGFLVADEHEMALAVARLGTLEPERCRASVAARYDVRSVVDRYEAIYRAAIARAEAARKRPAGRQRRGAPAAPAPARAPARVPR
jgi:glycosyltransferase involved in cell wall biosynthesis